MEKLFIQNRKGQKVSVAVEQSSPQTGLVFVMHGLGGFKEQAHVETLSSAFLQSGFTTIRFDTTNTLGESDGNYEDATVTNYYEDLEDVIAWSANQSWYQEPFALTGHSLGGICTALYAEHYPTKVLALAPISPVVSGVLSAEAHKKYDPEDLATWEAAGVSEKYSESKPGVIKRLKWSHMSDRLKYDLIPEINKLTMPVLLIVGENDKSTPPEHVKMFYELLPGTKQFHVIKNAPHTFRSAGDLTEINSLIQNWISSFRE